MWTSWEPWTRCTEACGIGERIRKRECSNPAPENNGEYCTGPRSEKEHCFAESSKQGKLKCISYQNESNTNINKLHLFTRVNIANEYIFSKQHYQDTTTIGPPLLPEPLLCPNGYELHPINQCICVVNEKYAYQYENINSVINQYECREQCETRLGCQYYEYNDTHSQCDVWNSNKAIENNPSVLWSHGLSNCSARKGNLHNIASVYNRSTYSSKNKINKIH